MDKRDMQLLETGLGNVTWWGYSPSFNILEGLTGSDGKNLQNFNSSNRIYQIVTYHDCRRKQCFAIGRIGRSSSL